MICSFCHHDNPPSNHFCGNCGLAMTGKPSTQDEELDIPEFDPEDILPPVQREPAKQPVPVFEEPEPAPPPRQTTISGPSFLGLTDSAEPSESYLLEDEEPRRGRMGWIIFSAVAVVVLSVIGWIEWRAYQTGTIQIPFFSKSAEQPKTTDETQGSSAVTNSETASNNTAETKPAPAETNPAAKSDLSSTTSPATTTPAPPATTSTASPADTATTKPEPVTPAPAATVQPTPPPKVEPAPVPTPKQPASKPAATKPKPVVRPEPEPKAADPRQNQMLQLGENYLYGKGVPRNCQQAKTYFESAARENNAPAMSHLGAMYAAGNCVPMNRRLAYQWFVRASNSDPHNPWIQRSMNMLWRDMSSDERASVSNQ